MTNELDVLRSDLVAEQDALDLVVANITDDQWQHSTPSPGWNVRDQIAHLTFFDHQGATAIEDPARFHEGLDELVSAIQHESIDDYTLGPLRSHSPQEVLGAWRRGREHLNNAASTLSVETRVPWYGPSMGAKSFLTARLMEVWAHGADVVDAVGAARPPTDRLRHIAQLGFITRTWSYRVRGEEVPDGEVRLELTGPDDDLWVWGPDDAADLISGSAEDFCLVVTQRRHVNDTSLKAGELGAHWLVRAQAFAGGPSNGPEARSV
ncbi:MAG TPA: TIGR03084 family metal-binding protein [Acidimicrobiales bacterium]